MCSPRTSLPAAANTGPPRPLLGPLIIVLSLLTGAPLLVLAGSAAARYALFASTGTAYLSAAIVEGSVRPGAEAQKILDSLQHLFTGSATRHRPPSSRSPSVLN